MTQIFNNGRRDKYIVAGSYTKIPYAGENGWTTANYTCTDQDRCTLEAHRAAKEAKDRRKHAVLFYSYYVQTQAKLSYVVWNTCINGKAENKSKKKISAKVIQYLLLGKKGGVVI